MQTNTYIPVEITDVDYYYMILMELQLIEMKLKTSTSLLMKILMRMITSLLKMVE